MNRRQKGNALSQYAIIIGLVVLLLVPTFMLFGNQIVNVFTTYVDQYTNMNDKIAINNKNNADVIASNTTIADAAIAETNQNSDKVGCSNNTCVIDFGDVKLSGVPQDLNKLVETTGVSGSMDNLTALLDQIAQQYEEQGKTAEANDIKILATTGHNLALIQKSFENFVFDTCKGDVACFNGYIEKNFPKPVGYDETYSKFPTNVTYDTVPWLTNIGAGVGNSSQFVTSNPEVTVATFYQNTLNKIISNKNISDSTKGIIRELSWDIGTISQKWMVPFSYITDPSQGSSTNVPTYEPLTGVETNKTYNMTTETAYIDIQNINAPELTNVDSGLICAAGGYSDSGTKCH